MKVILLRATVAAIVALLLPLPYPLLEVLGVSLETFVTGAVAVGVCLMWLALNWLESRPSKQSI